MTTNKNNERGPLATVLTRLACAVVLLAPVAACAETARSAGPVLPPTEPMTAEQANCGTFFVGKWSFEPVVGGSAAGGPRSVVEFAADGSFTRSDAPYADGSAPSGSPVTTGRWSGTAGSGQGYCVLSQTGAMAETVEFKLVSQNEITGKGVRGVRLAR